MYARVLENQQELRVIKSKAKKTYAQLQVDFLQYAVASIGCLALTIATPILLDGDGTAWIFEIPMCLYYMGKAKETWERL